MRKSESSWVRTKSRYCIFCTGSRYNKTMTDDRKVQYNIRAEIHEAMIESDMGGESVHQGGFYYSMEESLAENMYNLSMESDNTDDDVDLSPTPSSRPPPEPFGINDFSEDDPIEMDNMNTLASIGNMIEKHSTVYPDVRVIMKSVEPGFFKYGTVLAELQKWSCDAEDYLEENSFSSMDADSSYTP
ncbi:unnamed protein product [Euphydryas editha]|uniref:Uncharacterized protein n=1 Tax=Euphydryas editha TaxID=104508 RepID=A0AAU9UZ63_EUPED|nr:unnamed protein product [Euphydryas editha]